MKQIILSYTTLDMLHKSSHGWINKQLGIVTPESEAMKKGKEAHKRLQDHVSGITLIDGIDIPMTFPKIEYHARKSHNDTYLFHGYLDGANFASKAMLEIKTSGSKTWSQQDFHKSMQPAYYSFVTGLTNCYLVTCRFDLSDMKIYYREFTPEDWEKAQIWAIEGVEIIEKGDFTGGLDEQGKCTGCNWGNLCHFA